MVFVHPQTATCWAVDCDRLVSGPAQQRSGPICQERPRHDWHLSAACTAERRNAELHLQSMCSTDNTGMMHLKQNKQNDVQLKEQ